jgi:hypothetical protein
MFECPGAEVGAGAPIAQVLSEIRFEAAASLALCDMHKEMQE